MKHGRWLGRAVRGVRPDRNPLRRRSDRIEAFIFCGLVVAAAAGAPLAAMTASDWAHASAARAAHVQQETRRQVQAVLVAPPRAAGAGYTVDGMIPARAQWTAPNGVPRTGQISVPTNSTTGMTITVWTDQAGNVTSPPLTPAQVADQGTFAALVTVAAIVLACLLTAVATRILVNRRRMAAWTADWVVTAPLWNRQQRW
jgi:hypothetical protein